MKQEILTKVVRPLIRGRLLIAKAQRKNTADAQFIEELLQEIYRAHRGSSKLVKERRYEVLPNSERGKYRKLIQAEIKRHSRSN